MTKGSFHCYLSASLAQNRTELCRLGPLQSQSDRVGFRVRMTLGLGTFGLLCTRALSGVPMVATHLGSSGYKACHGQGLNSP